LGVEAEQFSVLVFEEAVFVAEADLPIVFGSMAGGDEQVGVVGVQRVYQRFRSIVGSFEFGGVAAAFLADHSIAFEFTEPHPLVDHFHGEFRAGGGLADCQGRRFLCDGKGVGCVVAGHDPPEEIGVGIVIELPGQLVDIDDKLSGDFRGLGNEGDVPGELFAQSANCFQWRVFVGDKRCLVFGDQGGGDLFPFGAVEAVLREQHGVG